MGISKTEINLRRLLAAAPQQQNQAKLIHYVATLRELLEELAEERTPDGLPRVSKAKMNDYSEKVETIASRLAGPLLKVRVPETLNSAKEILDADGETQFPSSPGLRRRFVAVSNVDSSAPVKLDTAAKAHIEKHRQLQDDLTDEMVGLAQQLKESSLLMSQSLQNTEKARIENHEELLERMVRGCTILVTQYPPFSNL
ncbi:uncharacterized protein [Euphorbia lathyris]|uniref:uncharacterized protein isoform X2 n=1 Tax=Euphorbia lathyris TaxID=212925 RepID=UPI00331423EF